MCLCKCIRRGCQMFRHYGKQIGAVVCKQLDSESTKCGGGEVKIRMQPKKNSNSYSVDLSSPPVFIGVPVTRSLVLCIYAL
jgi:hypothetical protein